MARTSLRRCPFPALVSLRALVGMLALVVAALLSVGCSDNEEQRQAKCQQNLRDLMALFQTEMQQSDGKPRYDGVALPLSWRQSGAIKEGQESVLFCPGDRTIAPPSTPDARARYDTIPLAPLPPEMAARMCGYSFRDFTRFPLDKNAPQPEIIACCGQQPDGKTSCHGAGINVAFSDGSVRFMSAAELGFKEWAPIVVGAASPNDMLHKMVHVPGE